MKIQIAGHAGFCFGVRKAVERALETVNNKSERHSIYSLGHIVHNSHVVSKLKEKGVIVVDSIDDIPDSGIVIIRYLYQ